jgi:hypothetical protein
VLLWAHAATGSASDVVLETGLHFGGDTFATVLFSSGDSVDINAGELFSFAVGGIIPVGRNLETQVTLGWKYEGTSAVNGDVSFERYPLNVLLFYRGGNWRWGGGLTYHLNPQVDGSGVGAGLKADFKDALGFVAEVDYQFNVFYLGARATFVDYETVSSSFTSKERFNGDSVGIIFGARF